MLRRAAAGALSWGARFGVVRGVAALVWLGRRLHTDHFLTLVDDGLRGFIDLSGRLLNRLIKAFVAEYSPLTRVRSRRSRQPEEEWRGLEQPD